MKRLVVLVAVVAGVGLLLGACGSDDGGNDSMQMRDDMMEDGDMMDHGGHMGGGRSRSSDVAEGARRVEVSATSFEFDPDEIRARAGEDIAISLTSTDILHDFTIDELDAHVSANRGQTEEGGFRAGRPGRYTYYCSVAGHREEGMEGTLVVE